MTIAADLPAPMTEVACDLRDFPFMPLHVDRLRTSRAWLKAKRIPFMAFYLINLWSAAWHEVPAGSLEDDDDVLANIAQADDRSWKKVRDEVMRGWVKCSDGRLYHPTVAELARDGWKRKQDQRQRTEAARQSRLQGRQQRLSPPSTGNVTTSVTENKSSVTDNVTGSKGQGQGQGQGQGHTPNPADASPPNPLDVFAPSTEKPATVVPPTDADEWRMRVCLEPWVKILTANGCKIGPNNWRLWRGLIDRVFNGKAENCAEFALHVRADERWPDRVETAMGAPDPKTAYQAEADAKYGKYENKP